MTIGVNLTSPGSSIVDGKSFGLGDRYEDKDGKEYVYVQANGAITGDGYVCTIDEDYQAAELSTSNDAEGDRIGVARAAFSDNDYGWVQVKGPGLIRVAASCSANAPLNSTATAGQIDDDGAVASMRIVGAWLTTSRGGSAGTAAGMLNYPVLEDIGAKYALLVGTQTIAGAKTFSDAVQLNGNVGIGNAVSDTVGFYGVTKVVQPASASQAAVTNTLVTAVALTLVTAVALTAATAVATTTPTATTTTYGYTTSTQAAKIVALVNQCKVDLATLKARVDQAKVDLATVKARVDQGKVDLAAHAVLENAVRSALVDLGVIKGAA